MSAWKFVLIDKHTRKLIRALAVPGEDTHETIRRVAERALVEQELAAGRIEYLSEPKDYQEV